MRKFLLHFSSMLLAAVFAFGMASCNKDVVSDPPQKHLLYFGYADATSEEALKQTDSYTNIVYFGVTATDDLNVILARLKEHKQLGILSIGPVLWDYTNQPAVLYSDWQERLTNWVSQNQAVFTPEYIFAVTPFDEPMHWGIDMKQYEALCRQLKVTFPWLKIFHVDGISPSAKANVNAYINSGGILPNVDIIAIDHYYIHPQSDQEFLDFIKIYKNSFPYRDWFYVMDGFWDKNHSDVLGDNINVMTGIANEYYAMAKNDPEAIGIGVFIWEANDANWTTSKDFPTGYQNTVKIIGKQIIP